MALTIDELQIEIQAKSTSAASGIDALAVSLGKLRTAAKGGVGLTTATKQLERFSKAVQAMQVPSQKIAELVSALKPLETIGKSNLGSALNQLKKIPQITDDLDDAKLTAFATKIQQVTVAIRPLAAEMEKVSNGFSKLPANIQKAINANAKLTTSNNKTSRSYGVMGTGIKQWIAKLGIAYLAVRRVARVVADWITQSNAYQENLNLFRVSMGEYYSEALNYAKQVEKVLGIDHSEWIRYQSVFQNMAEGFGIAADKALIMSRNLTQMGYDLGSVFNVKFDTAMEKLEAALGGQPRPMREWGFDLSEASLKAVALAHGIDKNVESMSQAEKAQLRYIQLWETMNRLGLSGDLKRTIESPANALRVLASNASIAARELGNLFIPALNKILPYATAIVKVVRWVASELASLFGFTMTDIDYSGLEGASTGLEDIEDAAGGAAGAAKELRKAIMGFDELNIISPNNTGGGAGGAAGSGGFNLDLPSTDDWIDDAVLQKADKLFTKWKKTLGPLVESIKKNFGTIKDSVIAIGVGILGWKLSSGLLTALSSLGGLSNFTKAAGLTLMFTGFAFEFSGFKDIGGGDANVWSYIKAAVGSALGVAGSLLTFGTGPLGWTIGIAAAIVIAVVGIAVGASENLTQMVSDAFYQFEDGKITITNLADSFATLMQAVTDANQPIIDGGETITQAMDNNVKPAITNINEIAKAIENGAFTAEEKIPELVASFEKLKSGTETILDTVYDNIVRAVSGSLYQSLADAGVYVPELLGILAGIKGEVDTTFDTITTSFEEAKKAFDDGKISPEEYATTIFGLTQQMQDLVVQTDPVKEAFAGVSDALAGINWEDEDAQNNAFAIISEAAANAQTSVDDAYKTIQENVDTMRGWSSDPSYQLALDQILLGNEATRATQLETIDNQLQSVFDAMQQSMIEKSQTVADKAAEEWNNMNWLEKWWNGGSEATYVAKALVNYQKNIIDPIEEEIETSFADLGIKAEPWASDAMTAILTNMFDYGLNGAGSYVKGYASDMQTEIEDAFGQLGLDVDTGFANSIEDNAFLVENAMRSVTGTSSSGMSHGGNGGIIGVTQDALDSHSPSKVFEDFGLNVDTGFANGITKNASLVTTAMNNLLNQLLTKMESFTNRCREALNSMLSDFSASMSKVSVSAKGSVSYSKMPYAYIPRFADGGYPATGQLFFANEAGPELVGKVNGRTAVANNDQIVEGVSRGVFEAVVAAMTTTSQNNGGSYKFEIDGREMTATVTKRQSAHERMYGRSYA